MISLAAYLFGIGVPESYPREILRQRARNLHMPPPKLAPAESGVSLGEMARVTILHPIKMTVTDPITIGISLYLGFNFAVLFSFFISIPVVLGTTYNFTVQQVGIAFIAAIVGSLLAALMSILMDRITARVFSNKGIVAPLEYRLLPAFAGGIFILASLFWIAWTASPRFHYISAILGTLLYVWGNMSVLVSAISYLFDAYPPRSTLSALTAAACMRLACAGVVSLFIIQMILGLTGAWTYSTFGFISAAMAPLPWLLFQLGPKLRARSSYGPDPMAMQGKKIGHEMINAEVKEEMHMDSQESTGYQGA